MPSSLQSCDPWRRRSASAPSLPRKPGIVGAEVAGLALDEVCVYAQRYGRLALAVIGAFAAGTDGAAAHASFEEPQVDLSKLPLLELQRSLESVQGIVSDGAGDIAASPDAASVPSEDPQADSPSVWPLAGSAAILLSLCLGLRALARRCWIQVGSK